MIRADNFDPWTVLERLPAEVGRYEVYMMYAGGPALILEGARLRISIANYHEETREQIEADLFA